jgi:DNA-directed RNA polymerase specialized sigma24 family protein
MRENYEELKKASIRISRGDGLAEELLHYCIEEFLHKTGIEDIVKSGGGRFYIVRMMMNQWNSSTSPFYNIYRKHEIPLDQEHEDIVEEEDESILELHDRVRGELDKLTWYDRVLFDTFVVDNHTVSSMARATGIPRTSISLSINRIRKHIKNNLDAKE